MFNRNIKMHYTYTIYRNEIQLVLNYANIKYELNLVFPDRKLSKFREYHLNKRNFPNS